MSDLPAVSTRFATTATASGLINGSYAAPSNHAVSAFFVFDTAGSAGGAPVYFEVYIADSVSGGTSTSWSRSKTNVAHAETLQGTALKYTVSPTPTNAVLMETVAVPTLSGAVSTVYRVPGGKVIYCKAICATDPTVCGVTLRTNE